MGRGIADRTTGVERQKLSTKTPQRAGLARAKRESERSKHWMEITKNETRYHKLDGREAPQPSPQTQNPDPGWSAHLQPRKTPRES